MNMRISINMKLGVVFFLLIMLCIHTKANTNNKSINEETIKNQQRLFHTNNKLDLCQTQNDTGDYKSLLTSIDENRESNENSKETRILSDSNYLIKLEKNNETNPEKETEEKLGFWSGFVDSLFMIFFVEFGDRVILSKY